jgi:hypothetical protein
LRAHVPRRIPISHLVEPRHERQAFEKRPVVALGLFGLLQDPASLHEALLIRDARSLRPQPSDKRREQSDESGKCDALDLVREDDERNGDDGAEHQTGNRRKPWAGTERAHV